GPPGLQDRPPKNGSGKNGAAREYGGSVHLASGYGFAARSSRERISPLTFVLVEPTTGPLNSVMRFPLTPAFAIFLASHLAAQTPEKAPVDQLIPWLLREDNELRTIPFSQVIFDTTGKRVLAINRQSESDQRLVNQLSLVLDEVIKRMNGPDSPLQKVGRINEASSHFEDLLREKLNRIPGFSCDFPRTSEDRVQRSGYPD